MTPHDGDILTRYTNWELRLALHLNRANHRHPVSRCFGFISRLGDGIFWYALIAALLAYDGAAALPAVLAMSAAGLSSTLLYKWIKTRISRLRPSQKTSAIRLTTPPWIDSVFLPAILCTRSASPWWLARTTLVYCSSWCRLLYWWRHPD